MNDPVFAIALATCALLGLLGTYRAARGTEGWHRLIAFVPAAFYLGSPLLMGALQSNGVTSSWVEWIFPFSLAATGISGLALIYRYPDPPPIRFLMKLFGRDP